MLNKIVSLIFIVVLSACSSKPSNDKSFVGTGEFNAVEAAKTRVSLGLTYLKNGNFSQAKFNLDKALEFAPRSGEAHYAMAFYYQKVEEVQRAEVYYESALGYSRNDPDVLNSYGAFLCEQGDYEKAKTYFLKAVDDKSYIATAETYENLAICAQNQNRKEEAKQYFLAALNHQPNRASTLFYLAEVYVNEKNWEEAKKSLWKYERNASVTADSLWMSYQISQGQNNLKGAVEYANILRGLYPNHQYTKAATSSLGKFQPKMTVTTKERTMDRAPDTVAQAPKLINNQSQAAVPKPEDTTLKQNSEASAEASTPKNTQISEEKSAFHIVQADENLYRISLKYNVKMRKLLEWNNITDQSTIRTGTKLRVRDPNTNE